MEGALPALGWEFLKQDHTCLVDYSNPDRLSKLNIMMLLILGEHFQEISLGGPMKIFG